jgi:hypothetical protein
LVTWSDLGYFYEAAVQCQREIAFGHEAFVRRSLALLILLFALDVRAVPGRMGGFEERGAILETDRGPKYPARSPLVVLSQRPVDDFARANGGFGLVTRR